MKIAIYWASAFEPIVTCVFTDDASLGLDADLRPQCEKLPMTNDKTANETADSKPETLLATSSLDFPVVGIGAPAGGVHTLLRLVENMPSDVGLAFVVVLHPSPKHESVAEQVLQRATKMPVIQVTTPTRIEKNRVYLISPSHNLSMEDGHLYFTHVDRLRGRPVTIDLFFRSLAEPSASFFLDPEMTGQLASVASRSSLYRVTRISSVSRLRTPGGPLRRTSCREYLTCLARLKRRKGAIVVD
jgi:CheB methylesterase